MSVVHSRPCCTQSTVIKHRGVYQIPTVLLITGNRQCMTRPTAELYGNSTNLAVYFVTSMSVCLFVLLFVHLHNWKTTWPNFTKFFIVIFDRWLWCLAAFRLTGLLL